MKEKRDEVIILRLTKTEKHCIYEKMLGMGIRSLSAYTPSCAGECVSGFDAAVDAESVCFHPCTADDVYFRLWTLYAVLPGVDAVLDPVGSRVRLFPAHHCRNGYCGSRGMVQRLDCRTVMGKVSAYCPYSRIDFISFAIYNRKTY